MKSYLHILHISVYFDEMGNGRRHILPLCCSTMPVNTFELGNNSVSCVSLEFDMQFYKIIHL